MNLRVKMAVDEDTTRLAIARRASLGGPPIAFGVFLAVNIDIEIVALEVIALPGLWPTLGALN